VHRLLHRTVRDHFASWAPESISTRYSPCPLLSDFLYLGLPIEKDSFASAPSSRDGKHKRVQFCPEILSKRGFHIGRKKDSLTKVCVKSNRTPRFGRKCGLDLVPG
jgi:hypothetical protein